MLPEIRSSSEIYGYISDKCLVGVPISGVSVTSNTSYYIHMCKYVIIKM